uniref:Uncharacterized protein n=1 Tax=Tetraselmis sp. GSL018 TaxID=582737 RepID=A0A061S424_9CHLO
MPLQNVFSTYRPLLKLAVEHDANHLLHFLLPCSISGQPLCCDTSTVSLVNKLRERFRSLSPINESDTRDDPRQIWRTLHLNLHRRKNWSASLAIRAETSVCDSRDSPNFDWFRRRMDSRAGLELGAAEMRRVGEQTELDVLDSMLQVGCRPTATVYLQALEQLSERHGAFPLTLDAFWRWEMYGAADGRTADHSEEIATALVRSALLDEGSGASDGRPAPPSWRHPVGVWRALVETAGALPSERATNQARGLNCLPPLPLPKNSPLCAIRQSSRKLRGISPSLPPLSEAAPAAPLVHCSLSVSPGGPAFASSCSGGSVPWGRTASRRMRRRRSRARPRL